MARQEITSEEIEEKLTALSFNLVGIGQPDILRGLQLAKKIGFKHINDCVHTAVAESLNCQVLYTYNKSDLTDCLIFRIPVLKKLLFNLRGLLQSLFVHPRKGCTGMKRL